MRIFVTVLTISLIGAGSVTASERITDRDYLRLVRCAGLTDGSNGDASAIDAVLRSANRGRAAQVRDRGMTRRRSASLEMRSASGEERQRLEAELATRCALPPV